MSDVDDGWSHAPGDYRRRPMRRGPAGPDIDLVAVARHQRAICICILLVIVLYVGFALLLPAVEDAGGRGPTAVLMFAWIAVLIGVGIYQLMNVFRLSKALGDGTFSAVLMTIGSLLSCLGLIVLLVLSSRASTLLSANGVKVGLLGADPGEVAQTLGDDRY